MSRCFRTVPPATAARAVLEAVFAGQQPYGGPRADSRYDETDGLARFQRNAVTEAENTIATFGGVLIADPVGMGKTRVGAALARAAAHTGRRTLVVIPSTLRRQWTAALRHLRRTEDDPSLITLTTHSDLSRNTGPDDEPAFARVVIDEAHAFRNPDTRRYRALARLTRTAEVVLLTATPINNSLLDLYFLIRLFAGDGTFAPLGAPDLHRLFHLASLAPDAPPSPALAAVLRAVTIRRTRTEVGLAHLPPDTRFPERAPPHTIRFTAGSAYRHWFDRATHTIETLRLAPYTLHDYGLGRDTGGGASTLLRLLLAKRLESGTAAFWRSVNDLCTRMGEFLMALERGFLRPPAQTHTREDDGGQLLFDELLFQPLPRHIDRDRLAADTRADLELLHGLAEMGATMDDPKTEALDRLLFADLARQQILVFTEFRDTATDLWRRFCHHGGVALIHGSAAWLGAGPASRNDVIRRFAPRANDAPGPPRHEAVRILFATDVLSEGLNLQDAAHVVSYDLPWNPVRLLQRIGRIDRLGSPHHTVHSHHFLPDAGLERLLGLVHRLRRKLAAIRLGLMTSSTSAHAIHPAEGELDAATPHDSDTFTIVERLASGDPNLLDDIERLDAAPLQIDSDLRRLWESLPPAVKGGASDATAGRVNSIGDNACITVARITVEPASPPAPDTPDAVVAVEMDGRTRLFETRRNGSAREAGTAAATLLETALRQTSTSRNQMKAAAATQTGTTTSRKHRMEAERHIKLATRVAQTAAQAPHHTLPANTPSSPRTRRTSPAHRALHYLRIAAATTPGGPAPELCTRIDTITTALTNCVRAGHDLALEELLAAWRWTNTSDPHPLCSQLEAVLQLAPLPPAPAHPAGSPRPRAVILIDSD